MNLAPRISIGQFKSRQRGRDFKELFRHQFLLAKSEMLVPAVWHRETLGPWTLGIGDALAVNEVQDVNGVRIGFILGIAWNSDGELVQGASLLPVDVDSDTLPDAFEAFVAQLGGRYVALLLTNRLSRLYSDPSGDMSWVYDPTLCAVGSSVSVLCAYPLQPNPKFRTKNLLTGLTSASLQNTIDRRAKRGVPNLYLDLETFSQHRFWPGSDFKLIIDEAEIDRACQRIAEKQTCILRALTSAFSCILPVTAGHDSRLLLACGSSFLEDFSEFSGYRFNNPTKRDTRIGRDLVSSLGQDYKTYFKVEPGRSNLRDFRLKTGWACTRAELSALGCLEQYTRDHLVLRGGGIEMLRATHWRSDRIGRPPHIRYGLKRLRLRDGTPDEMQTRWRPDFSKWLQSLPESTQSRCYDFLAIEQWLPNTLGAYYLGFNGNFFVNPFNDRELLGLAASIPPAVRKGGEVTRKVIRAASADIPVDKFN